MAIYKRASFKSALFFVEGHEASLGRKTAIHEFINSKIGKAGRVVEDLGSYGGRYVIPAIIVGDTDSQFNLRKQRLEDAINSEGSGILIHPIYGRKLVMVDGLPKVKEDIRELRKAYYNLSFIETDENIYPTSAITGNLGAINSAYQAVLDAFKPINDDVNKFLTGFNDVKENVQDLTETISGAVNYINGIGSEISSFVTDLFELQNSITSLITAPANLLTQLKTTYNNLGLLTDNFNDLFNLALNLNGKGKSRNQIEGNSFRVNAINDARKSLYFINDVATISIAYQAAANMNFTNQEQVIVIEKRLSKAFEAIDADFDDDVYYQLLNLRNQTRLYLNKIRINLARIVTKKYNEMPAALLSYKIYGTSERAQEIIDLNYISDPAFVSGEIKLLSS